MKWCDAPPSRFGPAPVAPSKPHIISTQIPRLDPLCEPFSRVPPDGSIKYLSGTSRSSTIGTPSSPVIHPGATGTPRRFANTILLPATELIEASNINGASCRVGIAIAIGFRPNIGFDPSTGTTLIPPEVIANPIMS